MKYLVGLLMLGLLAGCTHLSIDENAAYTRQWSGRPVGEFMAANPMGSTAELLKDATSGIPVGVKGTIGDDKVVTIFFMAYPEEALNRDWKMSDIGNQDIVGIQIMRKW
jgi:hypothetical protein